MQIPSPGFGDIAIWGTETLRKDRFLLTSSAAKGMNVIIMFSAPKDSSVPVNMGCPGQCHLRRAFVPPRSES